MNGKHRIRVARRLILNVFPVTLWMLCSSCRTPLEKDDGLLGIVYHTMKDADARDEKPDMTLVSVPSFAPAALPVQKPVKPLPVATPTAGDSGLETGNVAPVEPPSYRISPGDVLAVSYFLRPPEGMKDYLVDSQDVLTISVVAQQTYTADVNVRPDGCISFYLIGDIQAAGKTVPQIRTEVMERVAKHMAGAEVTVMLKESNALAREFLDNLRSSTDLGATRVVQIRHDGAVTFPLVGEVRAMGKTLSALSKEVEHEYNRMFRGSVAVTLNLNSSSDGNIAVLGEVRNPGRYTITTPVSPFFALAMAGGALDTARKTQVVVVKRTPAGRVGWHVVNLDVDSRGPLGPEIALAPQDMLLVPKTGVANLNVFVDQYIRRLLPLPTGMGFNYDLTPE